MEDVISSPADLSASVDFAAPADAGDSISAEPPSPDNEGAADFDELNATGDAQESADEEPPSPDNIQQEAAEDVEEAEQPPAADAADEELPEGVRKGQDRSGKRGLFVTPERWKTIYSEYKQLQTLSGIAGEPVTPELFDTYNRAYIGQEKTYSDLLGGDPKGVGAVLDHFLQEGARMHQEGEVGVDPIIPLASTFYDKIQAGHPEAYAAIRQKAANQLLEEMYAEAAASGNRNLWLSVGHIAKTIGQPFKRAEEMEQFARVQTDPVRALTQERDQLKAQLNGRSTNNQAAQFDSWKTSTKQAAIDAVMESAVTPALADIHEAWAKLPGGEQAFNDLVRDRLHGQVLKTMAQDTRFEDRMQLLRNNASRATSAQKRSEIGEEIKRAHVQRANLAVQAHRREVVDFANKTFKEQNDAKHARLAKAATHKAPSGPGAPVKRSLVPAGMDFDNATPGNLAASLKGLFQ